MCICRESISHSLQIFRDENDNYNSYSVDKAFPFATSIEWNLKCVFGWRRQLLLLLRWCSGLTDGRWHIFYGTSSAQRALHSWRQPHQQQWTVAVAHEQVVSKRRKCKRAIKDCIQFDVISYTLQQLFLTFVAHTGTHIIHSFSILLSSHRWIELERR